MNRFSVLTACLVLTGSLIHAIPGAAQQTPAPPSVPPPGARDQFQLELDKLRNQYEVHLGADPLGGAFFSPEVVMRYQQQINLTAQQRTAIVAAISAAQPRFVEAQWQLEPETAALGQLLQGARVDEAAVLQQIDRVLDIERQIKRIQIEMLVRIKNQLTEEQQTQLARLGGVRGLRGLVSPSGLYDELNKGIRGPDPYSAWLEGYQTDWFLKPLPPGSESGPR